METGQNINETVPFFMVSNMEKSLEFYVKGLGFQIQYRWIPKGKIEWCKLKREVGSLMLQEHKNMDTGFIKGGGKVGLGASIYFICEDAIKIYKEIISNGLSASEPFVSNNMWLTSIKDPDGYGINFESITDVPEETKYSEWSE